MFLKLKSIPQRYIFAIVGFLVTVIANMTRISLDITISYMVNRSMSSAPEKFDPHSCPDLMRVENRSDVVTSEFEQMGTFDWDDDTIKSVTSAFRRAYIMTQFLGGMVAEKKGGKKIVELSLLVISISTLIIPIASKHVGSNALYVLRFLNGMASSTSIPALLSMMSKWVPRDEQAFIASIIFPGALIGHVTASWLGDMMIETLGWETIYYTFGLFSFICFFLWKKLVYSTPNDHPAISESEKKYLNKIVPSLERTTKYELDPLPWKAYLRCGALWGTVTGYLGREWAFSIFTTQVPKFLKDVLRVNISFSAFLSYMPYMFMWLAALLFGFVCDIIVKKDICSVKNARRIFTSIGTFGSIFCIIVVMYSGCNLVLGIFSMFTGMTLLGSFYSGCMVSALDFAPNYAGSMIGVIDNVAINSVLLLPSLSEIVVTDALLQQWRLSFWIVIILLVICITTYIYYVQADQQWWDDVRKNGYPENWTHGLIACEGQIDENGQSIYRTKEKEETRISES